MWPQDFLRPANRQRFQTPLPSGFLENIVFLAKNDSLQADLITDPHVPIWIISGWPTARELKHVHTEVAARQAEHL
jgi:hypothetical protein